MVKSARLRAAWDAFLTALLRTDAFLTIHRRTGDVADATMA
jgi:hypothetical protein